MEKFEKEDGEDSSDESEEEMEVAEPSIAESQRMAKEAFLKAAGGTGMVEGGEDFGGLAKRSRTAEEEEKFENEYLAFVTKQEAQVRSNLSH